MNLILIEPGEIHAGEVRLADRRAGHILQVIRPALGDALRVGLVSGPRGTATVASLGEHEVLLEVALAGPGPERPPVDLCLAVPRPKALGRILQLVGAAGVGRLCLVNAWRVEKSFFQSPALSSGALRRQLLRGCEQGGTTWVPEVTVYERFRRWLDEDASRWPTLRLAAHPQAARLLESVVPPGTARRVLVAVGPEGGWIARELETFPRFGFSVVRLGEAVLRTEHAVAALLAQLALLGRIP